MKLDESMRERLRSLAREEHCELSPSARARLLERLPRELQRAQSWQALHVALLLLALAAALGYLSARAATILQPRPQRVGSETKLSPKRAFIATPSTSHLASPSPVRR